MLWLALVFFLVGPGWGQEGEEASRADREIVTSRTVPAEESGEKPDAEEEAPADESAQAPAASESGDTYTGEELAAPEPEYLGEGDVNKVKPAFADKLAQGREIKPVTRPGKKGRKAARKGAPSLKGRRSPSRGKAAVAAAVPAGKAPAGKAGPPPPPTVPLTPVAPFNP